MGDKALSQLTYVVRRSDRRTMSMEITAQGELLVRAPRRASDQAIRKFVSEHTEWIAAARSRWAARKAAHPEPTDAQREAMIRRAKEILPPKVRQYAALMGVQPTRITITGARTRFGSCSGKNALSFSWRLMDYPDEAIDYVVVHELAHIRHHDHSRAFYDFVASVMPDHQRRRGLLKK